jgi:predicted Zn-ribbon and HTH transcriptional regulator
LQPTTESDSASPPVKQNERAATFQRLKDIRQKLSSGEYEAVAKVAVRKGKDEKLWKCFKIIRDMKTRKLLNAAVCTNCGWVFSFVDSVGGTGTTSLSRHIGKCEQRPKPTNPFDDKQEAPAEAKVQFTEAAAGYCASGFHAPESMKGSGTQDLIQACIDIGVKYGRVDASSLMRDPKTISKYISEQANKFTKELVQEVIPFIQRRQAAATTDCWTEDFSKEHYLALNVHFITKDWVLVRRLLFIFPLNGEESCTSEYLQAALRDFVLKLGIDPELLGNIVFVTDGGADIVKALQNYRRIYCIEHALNIVVRTTLSVKYHTFVERVLHSCDEAKKIVDACNAWVRQVSGTFSGFSRKVSQKSQKSTIGFKLSD